MKTKIALFAALLCLVSAAVYASYLDVNKKKEAERAITDANGKAGQRGSSGILTNKDASGTGGGTNPNNNSSGSNTGAGDGTNSIDCTNSTTGDCQPDPYDGPGDDGVVGKSTGVPLLADTKGCNDVLDAFLNTSTYSSILDKAKPGAGLAKSSCDFSQTCTSDIFIDSGVASPGNVTSILSLSGLGSDDCSGCSIARGWSSALTNAWNLIATKLPRQDYSPRDGGKCGYSRYIYNSPITTGQTQISGTNVNDCTTKPPRCGLNEVSLVAGDDYQPKHSFFNFHFLIFQGKAPTHSSARVYIVRCCPNARCPSYQKADYTQGGKCVNR